MTLLTRVNVFVFWMILWQHVLPFGFTMSVKNFNTYKVKMHFCKDSKMWVWCLKFPDHYVKFGGQHWCWATCQISKWHEQWALYFDTQSRRLETQLSLVLLWTAPNLYSFSMTNIEDFCQSLHEWGPWTVHYLIKFWLILALILTLNFCYHRTVIFTLNFQWLASQWWFH